MEVFKENGYEEKQIEEETMKKRHKTTTNNNERKEQPICGVRKLRNITPQFNKIAREHNFKVASNSGTRVRDLTTKAKTRLGDKNSNVVYNIPCGCNKY